MTVEAIQDIGGTVLFQSRNPGAIEINGLKFKDFFAQNRRVEIVEQ